MDREEILANCKIKTEEQFIEECRKNAIKDEWYNFSEEHTKPVSIGKECVTYGNGGWTGCAIAEQRWDVAMEKLLKHKAFVEWEKSGAALKIEDVKFETKYYLEEIKGECARFWNGTQTGEPVQDLLDEGWIFDNYDWHEGVCNYHKIVNCKDLDAKIAIVFRKRTDERDKKEFGFTQSSLKGIYRYPLPKQFQKEVFGCIEKQKTLSEELKEKLAKYFEKSLLEDEFKALLKLKKQELKAMLKTINPSLSKNEQRKAICNASKSVCNKNPAYDNCFGNRGEEISEKNFDIAFKKAGI